MKIYAITKGEYSDYHICALTVDKEKADKLKKFFSFEGYDDDDGEYDYGQKARIEEFEDGEWNDLNKCWLCDGNGCNVEIYESDEEGVWADRSGKVNGVIVYAIDAEHAEKKAHDMIAEYKAKQCGIC